MPEPIGANAVVEGAICTHCKRRMARETFRKIAAAMWNDGATVAAIAEATGRTAGSVAGEISFMRADGWHVPRRAPRHRSFVACSTCGERLVDSTKPCGFCALEAVA